MSSSVVLGLKCADLLAGYFDNCGCEQVGTDDQGDAVARHDLATIANDLRQLLEILENGPASVVAQSVSASLVDWKIRRSKELCKNYHHILDFF
jgi:hypothetical protein